MNAVCVVRLYKEHGPATIDALKRNPAVSVPLVLHRLQMKASELREARRTQQRMWNELDRKYYLKSLDHQGLNFKQTDTKQLRSKALLAEIEAAFDEVSFHCLNCFHHRLLGVISGLLWVILGYNISPAGGV